jgi:hypothetical protein
MHFHSIRMESPHGATLSVAFDRVQLTEFNHISWVLRVLTIVSTANSCMDGFSSRDLGSVVTSSVLNNLNIPSTQDGFPFLGDQDDPETMEIVRPSRPRGDVAEKVSHYHLSKKYDDLAASKATRRMHVVVRRSDWPSMFRGPTSLATKE